ncbi:Crp/Fnr family transcriptional regulator [Desulfovibrio sp. UCD-KL4C]|uniref:Crp/Fnr family transcriptional regulator n=1 Tax=Desulfovibrio sp. UCD-KL4C TaxID=2578120 RepID=UPI0025BAE53B|nr:Crp/Fnr family transcriptional regulator [Desulfovibrio sp. UCD-KL4C]
MKVDTELSSNMEILSAIGTEIEVPKGARFDFRNIYYLKEGIAALTHLTLAGEQSSFIYFKPGMLLNFLRPIITATGIGSDITMKRLSSLDHGIYAKTKCKCLCINGATFLEQAERDSALYRMLLRSISENLINVLALSTELSTKPASLRVCQVLFDFMSDDTPPEIPRYLTYNEIAFYLSMHVITVTKIFKALKQSGVIDKKGRTTIVIDKARLFAIGTGVEELKY